MKRCICLTFFILLMLLCLPLPAGAEETEAQEISGLSLVQNAEGIQYPYYLFDKNRYESFKTQENATITLTHEGGIGSFYLSFGATYGTYSVTNEDTGESFIAGSQGYVHDFVDLQAQFGSCPTSVTLVFHSGPAVLDEIQVYGPGEVPASVQKWQEPVEGKTDLMLFATHSDDDQLFFAGLLPYYAVERNYQVQVVYLTNHYNMAPFRVHEVLDGLWAVGIRSYPVLGTYPDFGDTYSAEGAFEKFEMLGYTRESMTGFVVEQLRRFKPQVVVGHDFNGEYGHAQHRAFALLVADAVAVSQDPASHAESAERYGTWDVPKTYVHLYKENPIVMDWDIPMQNFGGLTPFEVSKNLGFPAHLSQQNGWSYFFAGKNTCKEIPNYNPAFYGLYRSTVGADLAKNDMFENLISYAEQDRIAEEARLKAEEEARKKAEEEARLKAEEEARKASEEAARQTQPTEETTPIPQETSMLSPEILDAVPVLFIAVPVGGILVPVLIRKHKNGK